MKLRIDILKDGVTTHSKIVESIEEKNSWIAEFEQFFPVGYQVIDTDVTNELKKEELLGIEDKIDLLCKKAYREIKLYNRKNFALAHVQAVINHPDFIKLYCLLDGGNPSLSLSVFNQIGFAGYPDTVLADINTYLNQAISLSNLEL